MAQQRRTVVGTFKDLAEKSASTALGVGKAAKAAATAAQNTATAQKNRIDIIQPSAWFQSTEQTGTGSLQNVAHGLGRVPALVIVRVTAGHNGSGGAGTQFPVVVDGPSSITNAQVTVTAGAKFRVLAV
jgi:hypothetical protein